MPYRRHTLRISKNEIPANLPTLLTQFPKSFQKIIDLSRTPDIESNAAEIEATVGRMVQEILKSSLSSNPA